MVGTDIPTTNASATIDDTMVDSSPPSNVDDGADDNFAHEVHVKLFDVLLYDRKDDPKIGHFLLENYGLHPGNLLHENLHHLNLLLESHHHHEARSSFLLRDSCWAFTEEDIPSYGCN
jgi:hypothetical protein